MNFSILTNGNLEIGYGHISRMLILADVFKSNGHSVQFIVDNSCSFGDRIEVRGFKVCKVDFQNSSQVLKILNTFKTNCTVIDCIEKKFIELNFLKKEKFFIVSITLFFFHLEERYEDISFFPSIADSKILQINSSLKICTGKHYLIFDREFENHCSKDFEKAPQNVLITMGGSDPKNITWNVFNALKSNKDYSFTFILSDQNIYYSIIKDIIVEIENIRLINFTEQMPSLMEENDLVIINGGSTRYEACLVKTPFIAISLHEIQFNITKELTDLGVGINLGLYNRLTRDEIENAVINLMQNNTERLEMYENMNGLFDCKGATRIYETIIQNYQN